MTIDEQLEEIRNDLRKCVGYDKKINTLVAAVEKLTDIVATRGVKAGNDDSEMDVDNDGGIRRVRDNPIPGEGVEFEPIDRSPKRTRLPGEGVDFEPLDSRLPK